MSVNFSIDFEFETDGRWIAEIDQLPGVLAYGTTREEAQARVEALAQRVLQTEQASSPKTCN